ncbi:hypothetical protein [Caldisericum sp.]|uniref:hypothetical protein n=1 Tax=Caldisericum sp. TaxID=2499687 RepID=UPI003D0D2D1F
MYDDIKALIESIGEFNSYIGKENIWEFVDFIDKRKSWDKGRYAIYLKSFVNDRG